MTDVADVAIVGGGPAGAALAVMLGRAGVGVTLFEQHPVPRDKTCAEGLMPAGVRVLERLGLADAPAGGRFRGIRYYGWGREVEAEFPAAPGFPAFGMGQRRLRLDAALFTAAASCPSVTAHAGVRVEGPLVQHGRVVGVRAGGQSVRARLVVAADGPRSPLRRAAGLDARPSGAARLGVRAHYRLAPGKRAPDVVEVYLGDGHELYVTPLAEDEVVVAALASRTTWDENARTRFPQWIAGQPALAARLEGSAQTSDLAGQSPLGSRSRAGHMPGMVLLGDAAGFVDPVTGQGLAQALLSAELLGRTIVRPHGIELGDDALAEFDRRRRALLRDGSLLTKFVLQLVERPAIARTMMRLMGATPSLYRHLIGVAAGTTPLVPG